MNKLNIDNELKSDICRDVDDKFDAFLEDVNKPIEADDTLDSRYEEFCRREMLALSD